MEITYSNSFNIQVFKTFSHIYGQHICLTTNQEATDSIQEASYLKTNSKLYIKEMKVAIWTSTVQELKNQTKVERIIREY